MVAPSFNPGQTLGHFRLLGEIGAGGFGIVYRAWDTGLQRDVALKVLNARALRDASARKRLRREALILSRLNHPNVEAVYDFRSDDGIDYLVLEYVPGVSLNERQEMGGAPEREVLHLGIQLAKGLGAAHAQRVLHRDLKPSNLRVRPDNVLKILDFGLAQLFALPEDKTETTDDTESPAQHPCAGTLAYLSPEQLEEKEPDTRSDIYSAGVVLYELATGSRPFPHRGEMLREAILHSAPPAPRSKNKNISSHLEAVILKCLEKDPECRYQSADDLLEDLKELARGSGRHPLRLRLRRIWRSGRRRVLGTIVALLLLATALSFVLWHKLVARPVPSHRSVLVSEFNNRTGDSVFDQTPRELISTALAQSPQVLVFPSSRIPDVLRRMQRPESVVVDEKIGAEICTREGLQSLVSGSVSKLGSRYLILVQVLNCNGDLIMSTEKDFVGPEQLAPAIDEIAARIRYKWGESNAAIAQDSQPLAVATSSSLEALKLYSSGKQQLYLGNPQAAASLFKRAVELDGSFAMAHEYLAIAYEHLADDDRAGDEYAKAARLSNRVTENEREKILGDYALFQSDIANALSHYQVLVALSPQDPAVHINLAKCYRREFRLDLAIPEIHKAINLDSSPSLKKNLAFYYFLSGDSERALNVAQGVIRQNPEDALALNLITTFYLGLGRETDADAIWQQMLRLGGNAASMARDGMADAAKTRDNLQEAVTQLQYGVIADNETDNTYDAARKQIFLAELYQASSDHNALANALYNLGQPAAPELIFLLGRLYARSGRISKAQDQLHRLEESGNRTPNVISLSNLLRSEIALAQNRPLDAVQFATVAVQQLNSTLAIETLGQAYESAGNREEAAHQYELLLSRRNERQLASIDSPALHAVALAHYRLGVLYQALGRTDRAQQEFRALLNYAGGYRTGPLYENARKRLDQISLKKGAE
jgi:serine/threonine protein kinase/tetratricopeptide (TPR) repeat protein